MIEGGRLPCDEGVVRAERAAEPCPPGARRWILGAAILGSGLSFVLGSAVNVALPAIQADLRATVADMLWVVNGYGLPLAALLLVGGAAADRLGRRRIYVLGMGTTAVAALLCTLARTPLQLTLGQAILGAGGALTVPTSLALISAFFRREERGRAIGTWAGATAVAGALGPVVGGWLVDSASWRWIYLAVAAGAVVAALLCLRFVPESRAQTDAPRPDWAGALLAVAGLTGVCYGLIAAADENGGFGVVAGLLGGLAALAAFLLVERRKGEGGAMLPLHLFRSTAFAGANALTVLLYFALGGVFFFLPFNLIRVQGYSATLAGAAFLPFTVAMGGLSRWAGGLLDRHGARRPLVAGSALAAAGFALFAVPGVGGSYWRTFFPPMLVLGLGMAVAVAPLTTVVLNAVPDRHTGIASGVNNTASRVAWLLAVAALGLVVQGVFAGALEDRLAGVTLSETGRATATAARSDLAGVTYPDALGAGERSLLERSVDAAFVDSFRVLMAIAAGLALLGSLTAWRTVRPDSTGGGRASRRVDLAGPDSTNR